MLTPQQRRWAASHDWFVKDNRDGSIEVLDRWSQLHSNGTVTHHEKQLHFAGTFKALRDWAGY